MKRKMLLVAMAFLPMMGFGQTILNGTSAEGVAMKFTVVSETDKTCEVGDDGDRSLDYNTGRDLEGTLTVPQTVDGYTVVGIGKTALQELDKIDKIVLPSTIKYINEHAFAWSYSMTSINLPEGLESIGNNAFENTNGLSEITLPSTLKEIGEKVFTDKYTPLRIISLITNPTDITENAFDNQLPRVLYVPAGTKALY